MRCHFELSHLLGTKDTIKGGVIKMCGGGNGGALAMRPSLCWGGGALGGVPLPELLFWDASGRGLVWGNQRPENSAGLFGGAFICLFIHFKEVFIAPGGK